MSKILPSLKTNTAGVRYDNETGLVCAGNAKLSHFSTLEKKKDYNKCPPFHRTPAH